VNRFGQYSPTFNKQYIATNLDLPFAVQTSVGVLQIDIQKDCIAFLPIKGVLSPTDQATSASTGCNALRLWVCYLGEGGSQINNRAFGGVVCYYGLNLVIQSSNLTDGNFRRFPDYGCDRRIAEEATGLVGIKCARCIRLLD
jgi:hypothetical protein